MRFINSKDYFRIWEITDLEGRADVRMSESRKLDLSNDYNKGLLNNGICNQQGYIDTNWNFVKFIGPAYQKLKEVKVGDKITNLTMEINNEPYYGNVNKEANDSISLLERMGVIAKNSIQLAPVKYGKVYSRVPRLIVRYFDIAKDEGENVSNGHYNMDKAPVVAPASQSSSYTGVTSNEWNKITPEMFNAEANNIPSANTEETDNCPF